ncbi:uncharacterized protein CEXT_31541 [Caerostris extrusa]|uniref:CMP domain-containing protein n=1 Tax=Caerostris extrusa TaxID=172846 RepID=A0AAV4UER6_CAEEX|nr:uncharacterized protein CEXT_31541 [Caerostris extrusa]
MATNPRHLVPYTRYEGIKGENRATSLIGLKARGDRKIFTIERLSGGSEKRLGEERQSSERKVFSESGSQADARQGVRGLGRLTAPGSSLPRKMLLLMQISEWGMEVGSAAALFFSFGSNNYCGFLLGGFIMNNLPPGLRAIQLKNWKPLTFDQITESPDATVGDILGELSSAATLRIRLYSRPKLHSANDVKEKLLQVLFGSIPEPIGQFRLSHRPGGCECYFSLL